jgi:hypothetical protein
VTRTDAAGPMTTLLPLLNTKFGLEKARMRPKDDGA